jgi:hypothetical protein
MANNANDTVRFYVGDLLGVLRHCRTTIEHHVDDENLRRISTAGPICRDIYNILDRQINALERRLEALGGATATGTIKDSVTSFTGWITGLYGKMRGETASRMLRDDYTALTFVSVCTTMLHTTALAVGDLATADLTRQFLHEYPPTIMSLGVLVPHAVVADLGADRVPIMDAQAAETAAQNLEDAWRSASRAAGTTPSASATY